MAKSDVALNGAALIIGSLLWQDDLKEDDKKRKVWRDNALEISKKIMVRVPIRYGRLSDGGVFTMTFSNSVRKKGSAFVVPFLKKDLSIHEIISEARKMSAAEGMQEKFVAVGRKGLWAVMGVVFNPKLENATIKEAVLEKWGSELEQKFASSEFSIDGEDCSILSNGELNIPWPTILDSRFCEALSNIDFIIASSTKPTEYPSIPELSAAAKNDKERYYFIENVKNGIATFQDNDVINSL